MIIPAVLGGLTVYQFTEGNYGWMTFWLILFILAFVDYLKNDI